MLDPNAGPPRIESRDAQAAEPRVAVLGGNLGSELLAALAGNGWALILCRDGAELLEAVVERRPRAVIIVMAGDEHDLKLLQLVRRAANEVPLILLAPEGDLGLQRTIQTMRPYYYDAGSFDSAELCDAVRSALRPARHPRSGR